MADDYYSTLGVKKTASQQEIKDAYKKLAKQFHPDINKEPGSTEKFKKVVEAYNVLSDDNQRRNYDQFGSAKQPGFSSQQGFSSNFDFRDFNFEDLFRGAFANSEFSDMFQGGRNSSGIRHGRNLRMDIELNFDEAVHGVEKEIELEVDDICQPCKGTGAEKEELETCKTCHGRGMETKTQRTPFGLFQSTTTCHTCEGEGKTAKTKCKKCHGKGFNRTEKKINIKIPAGVDTGSTLRVRGMGESGSRGGKKGDLIAVIYVSPSSIFKRDGSDVFVEKHITFPQAALGTELEIETVDGKETIKIPDGTQNNTLFRLKGKGIKKVDSSSRGDEFVRVIVEVPTKLNKKEKELIEQLQKELHIKK